MIGRVGKVGVRAHILVVGGLEPDRESATAIPTFAVGRQVSLIQAPVQTIHVHLSNMVGKSTQIGRSYPDKPLRN